LDGLNKSSYPYLLLTNDACNSVEEKAAYLNAAGIPVAPGHVLSAGNALKLWAQDNYHGGKFFQLGKMGIPSFADAAGITVTTIPQECGECCGVLCGEGPYDWQPAIEAVFNLLLKHPEYPLVVGNPDSYWASMRIQGWGIGSGAVARFICQVLADAGKKVVPTYLGKPYAPIYRCASPYLKTLFPEKDFSDPSRLLMVGDSLDSDIAGANANNITSALVMTGITTREILEAAPAHKHPVYVFRSV
jgi:ribonucleotide monophosphatase NagD (HAD superfamily)